MIISYIFVVANIIVILTSPSGALAAFAAIFELLFAGLIIKLFFAETNSACIRVNIILFTGIVIDNKPITLVFDIIGKKLATYEEFEAKFKQILV